MRCSCSVQKKDQKPNVISSQKVARMSTLSCHEHSSIEK